MIGYDSFLRPANSHDNNNRNNSKRNSGSRDNLQGSFGPAETGSNYLGFSYNLDEDVEPRS